MSIDTSEAFHNILQKANEPLYGLWLGMGSATTAEICSSCGFDWLLIDAEHGPNTLTTVLDQLRALNGSSASIITRLPLGQTELIKQYLDIGAHNLLIPMVESSEQAKALVRAARYPPQGIRGLGTSMARAARWNQDARYLTTANQRVSLIVQIETQTGLDNLLAICSVDGVNAVFIGPSDLSASLGFPGKVEHPKVVAAVNSAIEICAAAAMPVGVLALNQELIKAYCQQGAGFIGVGVDTILLSSAALKLARRSKGSLEEPEDRY